MGTSRIIFGASENSSWHPNKRQVLLASGWPSFPRSNSLCFYPSTEHQSTKFSFRFGLDAGIARKALATSLVFRRTSM